MCGICGKLIFDREAVVSPELLTSMADAIRHRGPDDDGYYLSGPVGLGFRRLSIIDLSTGHQPICNEDGSIWVVFNGEIYNYRQLRNELIASGHTLKTQTDTEVLVHLYEQYGTAMLQMLRGMFGFAIWDERKQILLLARDRVGIKPVYYCLTDRFLSFGSEIKAILADPEVKAEVVPASIDRFLTFYYLPGEETLFKNIFKLLPGTYLLAHDGKASVHQYWDLDFQQAEPAPSLELAEKQLLELLEKTVESHMISDVPVGFLLSGGMDSTAMLSFAVKNTGRPISSYTIGFNAPGVIDERPYARLVSERFGTKHYETSISAKEFSDFLPTYVWHMEEPVCEPPAVALFYVSKLARDHVKVLISGEGADEAFAGYSNYRNLVWLERIKTMLGPARSAVRKGFITLNRVLGSARVQQYARRLDVPLERYYYSRTSSPFNFFNDNARELYTKDFGTRVDKNRSLSPMEKGFATAASYQALAKMLYVDTKTWLPDDLLVKADKMTMANSVELRVPFLDHKVLEFAAALPSHYKLRRFTRKYLAKRALSASVPREILERPKAGFPVPYESWLRTDMNGWMHDVLLDQATLERGYFERKAIAGLVDQNSRSGAFSKEIFSLAVLELWHRVFLNSHATGGGGDSEFFNHPAPTRSKRQEMTAGF
jgi:asparagine synthase (glutamine-hydrolysing)